MSIVDLKSNLSNFNEGWKQQANQRKEDKSVNEKINRDFGNKSPIDKLISQIPDINMNYNRQSKVISNSLLNNDIEKNDKNSQGVKIPDIDLMRNKISLSEIERDNFTSKINDDFKISQNLEDKKIIEIKKDLDKEKVVNPNIELRKDLNQSQLQDVKIEDINKAIQISGRHEQSNIEVNQTEEKDLTSQSNIEVDETQKQGRHEESNIEVDESKKEFERSGVEISKEELTFNNENQSSFEKNESQKEIEREGKEVNDFESQINNEEQSSFEKNESQKEFQREGIDVNKTEIEGRHEHSNIEVNNSKLTFERSGVEVNSISQISGRHTEGIDVNKDEVIINNEEQSSFEKNETEKTFERIGTEVNNSKLTFERQGIDVNKSQLTFQREGKEVNESKKTFEREGKEKTDSILTFERVGKDVTNTSLISGRYEDFQLDNFPNTVNFFSDTNSSGFALNQQETKFNTQSSIFVWSGNKNNAPSTNYFSNQNAEGFTKFHQLYDTKFNTNSSQYTFSGTPPNTNYFSDINQTGFTLNQQLQDSKFIEDTSNLVWKGSKGNAPATNYFADDKHEGFKKEVQYQQTDFKPDTSQFTFKGSKENAPSTNYFIDNNSDGFNKFSQLHESNFKKDTSQFTFKGNKNQAPEVNDFLDIHHKGFKNFSRIHESDFEGKQSEFTFSGNTPAGVNFFTDTNSSGFTVKQKESNLKDQSSLLSWEGGRGEAPNTDFFTNVNVKSGFDKFFSDTKYLPDTSLHSLKEVEKFDKESVNIGNIPEREKDEVELKEKEKYEENVEQKTKLSKESIKEFLDDAKGKIYDIRNEVLYYASPLENVVPFLSTPIKTLKNLESLKIKDNETYQGITKDLNDATSGVIDSIKETAGIGEDASQNRLVTLMKDMFPSHLKLENDPNERTALDDATDAVKKGAKKVPFWGEVINLLSSNKGDEPKTAHRSSTSTGGEDSGDYKLFVPKHQYISTLNNNTDEKGASTKNIDENSMDINQFDDAYDYSAKKRYDEFKGKKEVQYNSKDKRPEVDSVALYRPNPDKKEERNHTTFSPYYGKYKISYFDNENQYMSTLNKNTVDSTKNDDTQKLDLENWEIDYQYTITNRYIAFYDMAPEQVKSNETLEERDFTLNNPFNKKHLHDQKTPLNIPSTKNENMQQKMAPGLKEYETLAYDKLNRKTENDPGAEGFNDFRHNLTENQNTKNFSSDPKKINYEVNNIEKKYGFGKLGKTNQDKSDPKKITDRYDKINFIDFKKGKINEVYDNETDIVAFYLTGTDETDDIITFRASIGSISDSFSPSWSAQNYIGRADPVYIYNTFERSVSIDFKVAAFSRQEMRPMWRKINMLASYTTPEYTDAGHIKSPLMRLTLGNLFQRTPGFIESLSYSIDNTQTTWEINQDGETLQLPKVVDISLGYKVIGGFRPQLRGNLYSLFEGDIVGKPQKKGEGDSGTGYVNFFEKDELGKAMNDDEYQAELKDHNDSGDNNV